MAKVVIIGAGLTGISTAYHLEKKGFFDYVLVEKEAEIGGLCRSVQQDGFTFDYTGHFLHINDPYVQKLVDQTMGLTTFNRITRKSFIYSHSTYTPYPYQINLHGLPSHIIAECIEGFVRRPKKTTQPTTYYQWVLAHFGRGFGKHFFFPYQQKLFAYDLRKLTHSWTGRFVPQTSLEQLIDHTVYPEKKLSVGYNAHFYYPRQGGIVSLVKELAQQLLNPITKNMCVKKIDLQKRLIHFNNGHAEPYTYLVSTMPLKQLLANITETSRTNFNRAAHNLRCNSVINFNLGITQPDISDKNWIYFPEKQYPFYRLGFVHNLALSMAPTGCSSLYGELSYFGQSRSSVEENLQRALQQTKHFFKLNNRDIATEIVLELPHAYVIYDSWREKNLTHLLQALEKESIFSVGRYGGWKYASMQEALLDGQQTAHAIINNHHKPAQSRISHVKNNNPLQEHTL